MLMRFVKSHRNKQMLRNK